MFTEVVDSLSRDTGRDVLTMSPEELKTELDGVLHATNELEARAQELHFEEIARIFLDAHDVKVQELQDTKREQILDMLLDNPAEAFRGEFLQLQLLFEARSVNDDRYDGTQIQQFCTQDHEKGTCDYLFSHRVLPSGSEIYEVRKVYTVFGKPDLITVTLRDNEFEVMGEERIRGVMMPRAIEGIMRERVLAQLFYDTIRASAAQFERGPDERTENDQRAQGYLWALRRSESRLL